MTTQDINTTRLDIVKRLQAVDRRRVIAIVRSSRGNGFVVTAPVSDPAVAQWLDDGAPTCGATWSGDYSNVEPAEYRAGHVGE